MTNTISRLFLVSCVASALALSAAAQETPKQSQQGSSQQQARSSSPSSQSRSSQPAGQGTSASASASNSASASASGGPASASLASGTAVNAELTSTVDARNCHPGQEITAKTTQDIKQDGHVVLRRGTHLIGHLSEAEARTKANAESSVSIVFDEAVMRNGEHVPFHASIQALAETQAAAPAAFDDGGMPDTMGGSSGEGYGGVSGSSRGGLLGGGGAAVGSVAGNAGATAGALDRSTGHAIGAESSTTGAAAGRVGGLNAAGQLTSQSRGVFGLQGVNLESSSSTAVEGSLITSSSRNVHLSSGTQMLLSVTAH